MSMSTSRWPSTMATRSSSACVALNNMRFIQHSLRLLRGAQQAEANGRDGRADEDQWTDTRARRRGGAPGFRPRAAWSGPATRARAAPGGAACSGRTGATTMWSWFPNLISLFLRRRAPRSGSKQFASAAPAQRGPAQSMACATWPPGRPDCESRKPDRLPNRCPQIADHGANARTATSLRFRRMACSAQLQFPAIAGFPGRYRPKPEPFIRARLARRQAGAYRPAPSGSAEKPRPLKYMQDGCYP